MISTQSLQCTYPNNFLVNIITQSGEKTMKPPNLIVTAIVHDFDAETIEHFRDEGFHVTYVPFKYSSPHLYEKKLTSLADTLEEGERYAIVGLYT